MAAQHEVLIHKSGAERGRAFMRYLADAVRRYGDRAVVTDRYAGSGHVLFLYGVGAEDRRIARQTQLAHGRHVVSFDLGYYGRDEYMRMSIDTDHPQRMFDNTPNSPARWDQLGIATTQSYDPSGPIILVGLGRKTLRIPGVQNWETSKLVDLRRRFPDTRILYRAKPSSRDIHSLPDVELASVDKPIAAILHGASLVVCKHSNVAVDAVVAGVPFEADDGAATWLYGKTYDIQTRLDFLYRLAHWQWRAGELLDCLKFIMPFIPKGQDFHGVTETERVLRQTPAGRIYQHRHRR